MRDPLFPNSRTWKAKWIWPENLSGPNVRALFRIEFDADDLSGARLCICADTHYRAYLDGERIGDGPVPSNPAMQYYDERALPAVGPGPHCLAIVVQHLGKNPRNQAGLLAELVRADGSVITATGDGSWLTREAAAWRRNSEYFGMNKIHPFQEHFDARRMPAGWTDAGVSLEGWAQPGVLGARARQSAEVAGAWTRLVPRDIAFLEERTSYASEVNCVEECLDLRNRMRPGDLSVSLAQVGRPVDWATLDAPEALLGEGGETRLCCSTRHHDLDVDGRYDPALVLDFGRVLTGFAELQIEDAPDGAELEIGYAERLVDGRFNTTIEGGFADCITLAAGETSFMPQGWRSFRYLRLRVKEAEQPVRIRSFHAREIRYPYAHRGDFACEHGRLKAIERICRGTLELCSIESLMDTPQREQAQWLGDVAAVTVPGIHACFGDTALPGKFLRQASVNTLNTGMLANLSNLADGGGGQNAIPDYSLWWVICLYRSYLYTGDERYLHECYPEAVRVMRAHLYCTAADGIVENVPGWIFIDWAHIDTRGACAPYNAIYAEACDALSAIAAFKGDCWTAGRFTEAAADVRAAFRSRFYDPERGVIADCVDAGALSDRASEQGNMAAIAFGCVDAELAGELIDRLFESKSLRTTEAQPFFMVVVLEALCRMGRRDLALELTEHRWGRMLDRGVTSCSEEWYNNGSWRGGEWAGFMRTHSHAWSACAAEFLIRQLPGIDILEPGCAAVSVDPYPATFAYRSRFPIPQGEIVVDWNGENATITAPDGVAVTKA